MRFIEAILNLDIKITNYAELHFHNPLCDRLMSFFSAIGEFGAVWIVIVIFCLISKKQRQTGILMAASLLITFILTSLILKNLIQRPRPFQLLENIHLIIKPPLERFSFPSGHTSSAFTAATAILLNSRKRLFSAGAILLAAIIAFSRIYLKVHFFSDVFGGLLCGVLVAGGLTLLHKLVIPANIRALYTPKLPR